MSTAQDGAQSTERPSRAGTPPVELSPDTVFMILKNQRRRAVLRYLERNDEETTLDSLARHIAAKENGIDERALSSSQRKRVYIGLYQAHLPKMDDAGVIAFDKHRGQIELQPRAARLLEYLPERRGSAASPGAYLLAAIATGLLVGVHALGLVTVPGAPLLAGFVVLGAAAHSYLRR